MSSSLILKRQGFFGGPRWWGIEYSLVSHDGSNYLERWIAYGFGLSFRIHKFYRGDDDRAPHDHPWWFVTFPLRTYEEVVAERSVLIHKTVRAWRPHFRPATYRHIVKMPPGAAPFYTIVISGQRSRSWGFWPSDKTFVYYKDWI